MDEVRWLMLALGFVVGLIIGLEVARRAYRESAALFAKTSQSIAIALGEDSAQ